MPNNCLMIGTLSGLYDKNSDDFSLAKKFVFHCFHNWFPPQIKHNLLVKSETNPTQNGQRILLEFCKNFFLTYESNSGDSVGVSGFSGMLILYLKDKICKLFWDRMASWINEINFICLLKQNK